MKVRAGVGGGSPPFERAELAASLDVILGGDVRAAEALARLLDSFREALDGGWRGACEARAGLVAAVELVYLRTNAHASALRLYRLSLEGHVLAGDEPCALIDAAIGRAGRSVRAARAHGKSEKLFL
ncbi:MAG TPA: hypothetical protein VM864_13870 [Pyrinomonadaceae bacterium]|jgi:hypothetical protein|nr:hypothetical protein [Pyrinomonadaceae bacterium]